eukprot:Skav224383  [mRNA]  locus=scaffold1155:259373:259629:- [translate_table: standard]
MAGRSRAFGHGSRHKDCNLHPGHHQSTCKWRSLCCRNLNGNMEKKAYKHHVGSIALCLLLSTRDLLHHHHPNLQSADAQV